MPIQMDQQFDEKPVRNIPWYYLFDRAVSAIIRNLPEMST